jgi:hypothetical protein
MMGNKIFEENIPSQQIKLLSKMEKSVINRVVRCSWDSPEKVANQIAEYFDAPTTSVFRRAVGALLIFFESGLVLGFGDQDSKASITVWLERDEKGECNEEFSVINDNELFFVEACDPIYSEESICQLVGKRIIKLSILKREPQNSLYVGLPCEAGLALRFENNSELILSHNLGESLDNFALLFRDKIDPEILDQLQEMPI